MAEWHKFSQTARPVIIPPAFSILVITVASIFYIAILPVIHHKDRKSKALPGDVQVYSL